MRILLLAAAMTAAIAPAATARTVVVNANGITLDARGAVQRFATLVVGDDGRVEATLPAGAVPPAGTRIDAGGKTVMPGLIDGHGHVMELGYAALSVDLSATKSLAEALALVKAYAAAHPEARWIVGGGWNQEIWRLGRFPTAPNSTPPSATALRTSAASTATPAGPTARGSPPPG